MTPEQLETLVLSAKNGSQMQLALATLTEPERKKLSATAQSLYKQISSYTADTNASKQLKNSIRSEKEKVNRPRHFFGVEKGRSISANATLALFALGPASALKRQNLFVRFNEQDVFEQIIIDRKPDWLDDWLAFEFQKEWSSVAGYPTVRRWIRAGICKKPEAEGYYRQFASHLMAARYNKTPNPPISEQLLAEPDLLEDVWRLFEVENFAFDTYSWLTNRTPDNYETWPEALLKLSNTGHLDRDRLLNASLQGLHQDLKQNQLAGFHKFHQFLKPTKAELLERQPDYIALLCHKVGHVVKFALSMLSQLEKDKQLDAGLFLAEIQPVFFHESKSNAVSALKLIKRIIKSYPESADAGLKAAVEALRHPSRDVQSAGLEVLENVKAKLDDTLKADIGSMSDFVAASLKDRLLNLTRGLENMHGSSLHSAATAQQFGDFTENNQIKTLAERSGIGSETVCYTPFSQNILNQCILPTVTPVVPIEDVDELIHAVAHAVEIVDHPDEVERILDGISRLCNTKPNDFNEKTAPLLIRLENGGLSTKDGIAGEMGGLRLALANLLRTWLTGRLHYSPMHKYFSPLDSAEPTYRRLRGLTKRVSRGVSQPLIAAPTHTGGWVDPVIWVNRLFQSEANKIDFDRMELCISMLRLTPDRRKEALQSLQTKPVSRYKRLAEFVLGGDNLPEPADRKDYALWISAARARDPYANWSARFEPLQLGDTWPDSVKPAAHTWQAYVETKRQEYNYGGKKTVKEWKIPKLDISANGPSSPQQEQSKSFLGAINRALSLRLTTDWKTIPSSALNQRNPIKYSWFSENSTGWITHWLTYQWPLKPDGIYLSAATRLVARMDMDSSNLEPTWGYFQGLFQNNRPWREAAHLLVCVGLTSKDADASGLAKDALIWAIENGAADVSILAQTLIGLSNGGWVKLNRLGDNFLQISQVSKLHACVVSEVIQLWLPHADAKQQNFFKMLEVLLEAQSELAQTLKPAVKITIQQLKAGGKAARLAKDLLNLETTGQMSD